MVSTDIFIIGSKKILIIFIGLIAIGATVFIFPFLIPIYLFRFLVSFSSTFIRPDLKKILTTRSTIFACDDLYNKPRSVLIVRFDISGHVDVHVGQEYISERLIRSVKANGEKVRPELTQYITQWLGFFFWKEDEEFNISDHLHVYNGKYVSSEYTVPDLQHITNELIIKAFSPNKSPWEFIILHNSLNEKSERMTTVLFRVHHALADGFSILSLVSEITKSEGNSKPSQFSKMSRTSTWTQVVNKLRFLICGPFEAVAQCIDAYDVNEWHLPEKKLTGVVGAAVYEKISVEYIKEIKTLYGVSFTTVILEAFTGGLRRFMLENCVRVPNKIHCVAPLPMPGHSGKLRNFMTFCYISLPVGLPDSKQRLLKIERHLTRLKRSPAPILAFYLMPFIGALFPFMTKYLSKQLLVTGVFSNFPGPPDKLTYLGTPVTDILFTGGLLPGSIGIGFTALSYNGFIRIATGMDESILPQNAPVYNLVENIKQELDLLKKEAYC